jgi:hypothetical protein
LEEYLIMPTAWYYIKELGETTFFLGVTLAGWGAGYFPVHWSTGRQISYH